MRILVLTGLALVLLAGCKTIENRVEINAPPHEVWSVLTDFQAYPQWNPFILKLEGNFRVGQTIMTRIQPVGSDPITFHPVLLEISPDKTLRWEGSLLPGIFVGQHSFHLRLLENGKTELVQREDFSGVLVPFFGTDPTLRGFEAMNQALKQRTETRN